MSKARILGYNKPFTPNSKADMRYRQKARLRNKERMDDFDEKRRQGKEATKQQRK